MKQFDFDKVGAGAKVQTRDGRSVRILAMDVISSYPIVALIYTGVEEYAASYNKHGKILTDEINAEDLVMAPIKKTAWINVWEDVSTETYRYSSKDAALFAASAHEGNCLATIPIEWEG